MQQRNDDLLLHLGARIYAARQARQWSMQTLARASGVNTATICLVENNRINPRFGLVVALADALGSELAELVPGRRAA